VRGAAHEEFVSEVVDELAKALLAHAKYQGSYSETRQVKGLVLLGPVASDT